MNSLGKYRRALSYVSKLEEKAKIDLKDFKQVQDLKKKLQHTGMKLRTFEITRMFFFILLYSSVVSAFTSFIPGSEIITTNIAKVGGFLGSTLSLVIIGLTSKTIALYILDLNMISAHLISIYSKNVKHRNLRKKKK